MTVLVPLTALVLLLVLEFTVPFDNTMAPCPWPLEPVVKIPGFEAMGVAS